VVQREQQPDHGQRHGVPPRLRVAAECGDEEHDRLRVHENALEPAHLAGREVRDVRVVERSDGRDRGDAERQPRASTEQERAELVRARRAGHGGDRD